MKRVGLHFPRFFKAALWLLVFMSFGTGLTWFLLHRWYRVQSEFGVEHSSWEPLLMRIHGASATLVGVYFGYLLGTHVTVALRARRNRALGFAVLGATGFMILSGYGLYYCGDEVIRAWIGWSHLASGVSLPLLLGWHVATARRGPPRRRPRPH